MSTVHIKGELDGYYARLSVYSDRATDRQGDVHEVLVFNSGGMAALSKEDLITLRDLIDVFLKTRDFT